MQRCVLLRYFPVYHTVVSSTLTCTSFCRPSNEQQAQVGDNINNLDVSTLIEQMYLININRHSSPFWTITAVLWQNWIFMFFATL